MNQNSPLIEPRNEHAVCLTVLHDLARALNVEVANLRWVDEENRQSQAIELEAHTSGPILSFEHTRVEAYGGQIGDGQKFLELVWELEQTPPDELRGPLRVSFDLFATRYRRAAEIPGVIRELVQWLLSLDASLGQEDVATRKFGSANVGVTVSWRKYGTKPLLFGRSLDAGLDVEEQRRDRIARALDRKLPKLKAAKGVRVLILESNDIALSNHVVVCEAILAIATRHEWLPEYIYGRDRVRAMADLPGQGTG